MKVTSPLSGSDNVTYLSSISTDQLIRLWEKRMKIDIINELEGAQEIQYYECVESGLRFFYPMLSGSEKLYESLQKCDWYYLDEKSEYDFASKYIGEESSVLEVGCGRGAFYEKISTKQYIGLEYSKAATKIANASGIDVRTESIEDHSSSSYHEYDVVCSFQVLEHVTDISSFISSCLQCVKPNGFLIFSVPSADSYIALLKNSILNLPPHHVTHWPDSTFKYVADEFNLSLHAIEHERLSDIHLKQYSNLVITEAINQLLGRPTPLIDRSLTSKLIAKIANFGESFIARGFSDARVRPRGHSVTVVFRKNEN